MILVPALTALCDSLSMQTGAHVTLGRPEDGASRGMVYVWPWKLAEDAATRAAPAGASGEHVQILVVHALVIVRPATTPGGLALLDAARRALLDQPVLDAAGRRVQVHIEALSHADLSALFAAAALPLSIGLPVVLRAAA